VLLSLVTSLILTRLDYGSATLSGVPGDLLNRLQSVLNAAARLVSHTRKYDHVTHLLRDFAMVAGSVENTLPTGRACLPLSSQHGASVPRP